MSKYYLVYKVTNTLNNFIYVGVHATNKLNDNYLGSGSLILKAIKEFGRKNFNKEILFFCKSKEEMFEKEKEIVNLDFIKREDTYNRVKGGIGWSTFGMTHTEESRKRMSESWKNRIISEETRKKMSESKKGKTFTKEHKEKIGLSNSTRIVTEETRKKMSEKRKQRIVTEETRKKMSLALSKRIIKEETRKKLSLASASRKHTDETKKKISDLAKLRWKKIKSEG